jgi:tRNA A-37 threonylcarbamoyl transferase component Bud32
VSSLWSFFKIKIESDVTPDLVTEDLRARTRREAYNIKIYLAFGVTTPINYTVLKKNTGKEGPC